MSERIPQKLGKVIKIDEEQIHQNFYQIVIFIVFSLCFCMHCGSNSPLWKYDLIGQSP